MDLTDIKTVSHKKQQREEEKKELNERRQKRDEEKQQREEEKKREKEELYERRQKRDEEKQQREEEKKREKEELNERRTKKQGDEKLEKDKINERRQLKQEEEILKKEEHKQKQLLKTEEDKQRETYILNEDINESIEEDGKKATNFKTNYTFGDLLIFIKSNRLSYYELVQYFNLNGYKVFCILLQNKMSLLKKETQTTHSQIENMNFWTPEFYITAQDGTQLKKQANIFDLLIESGHRIYQDTVFKPEKVGHFYDQLERQHYFNEWRGFRMNDPDFYLKYDDIIMEYINDINKHILEIICNHNTEIFEYLINWISHIIQNPFIKTEKGIFLYSEDEGTGKSHFVKWLGIDIFGKEYFETTNDTTSVLGHFNSILKNKLCINMDEGKDSNYNGFKNDQDRLKNCISEEYRLITEKGKESKTHPCYINWIFTSNNKNSMECKNDTSRRIIGIEVNNKFTQRNSEEDNDTREQDLENNTIRKYWYNIRHPKNPHRVFRLETSRHYFHYLRTKDLSNFDIRNSPNTNLRRELINNSLKPVDTFIKKLKKGYFNGKIEQLKNINYNGKFTKNKGIKHNITHGVSVSRFYNEIYKEELKNQGQEKFVGKMDTLKTAMTKNGFIFVEYRTPHLTPSSTTGKIYNDNIDLYLLDIPEQDITETIDTIQPNISKLTSMEELDNYET